MGKSDNNVAVIYLAWLPYGIDYFKNFIESYLRYPAGYENTFVIAFNGLALEYKNSPKEYIDYLEKRNIPNVEFYYFDRGQDIEIYKKIAKIIPEDYILFFNSYTKLKYKNWLKFYIQNYNQGIGLIGATASNASYLKMINRISAKKIFSDISFKEKVDVFRYFVKLNIFYRKQFAKFPNPHIRTNAFFISKKLFNEVEIIYPKNKTQAYFFENGYNSLTNQIIRKGLKCIVIDKNGEPYFVNDWPRCNIFWQGNQGNLLISDNQTDKYDNASNEEKLELRKYAWNF